MSLIWQYRPADIRLTTTTTMSDIKPAPGYATAQVQSSDVRFIQSSSSSLRTLSNLPTDQLVILFTPAIPLNNDDSQTQAARHVGAGAGAGGGGYQDPFEYLGRALSKRHARVRHVPFVAKVGLTDLHAAWMRKAGAIVVVNCDPSLLVDIKGSSTNTNTNMSLQATFATEVSEVLQSVCGGAAAAAASSSSSETDKPLSCIHISSSSASAAQSTRGYDNLILCSSYSTANMEKAASMLMG
jgi:hypothetical protein